MTILIIDDDRDYLDDIPAMLGDTYGCLTAQNGREGLRVFREQSVDLVLLDICLRDGYEGLELLQRFKQADPLIPVIMITNYDDVDTVVKAMRLGAYDYFDKKFDVAKLEQVIANALHERRLILENLSLREELQQYESPVVYRSEAMEAVMGQARQAAAADCAVMITGETGVGKNIIAKEVHRLSERRGRPFVTVNVNAIPETMFESELFGHEKGAFTGAVQLRRGKFELADTGTIFLDEVSEIDPALQAKLLRVIEDQEYERLGGSSTRRLDVRVISATNRDVEEMLDTGQFRRDLYYRLNVLRVGIPPLRDRVADVGPLAGLFLNAQVQRTGGLPRGISEAALRVLQQYRWPGNVRELQNVIERAAIRTTSPVLEPGDFEDVRADPEVFRPYKEARARVLDDFKREYLGRVIDMGDGNISEAARLAGIPRQSLHEMLRGLPVRQDAAEAHGEAEAP